MAKPHLLLVDNEPTSFRVLDVSFRRAGFLVTTAATGREALEKVATSNPDVIIAETKLPEVDGFEFCRRVKAHPDWSQIPFLFLSGQTALESKVHGLELGVEDYLTKPILVREVLARVRILLQRRERDQIERCDAKTKVSGTLAEMGIVDLIQTIAIGRKTGQLQVTIGARAAVVTFRDGKILGAEYGVLRDERAVYRLFQAVDGVFELDFREVDSPSRIAQSTEALLMEGMSRIDQWVRFEEQLPSFDKAIEVDYAQLGNRLSELPDDANPLLKLIDGKRTLRQVIDECELDEIASLNLISKLFFEGILTEEGRPREPSSEMSLQSLQGWVDGEVGAPGAADGVDVSAPAEAESPFAPTASEAAESPAPRETTDSPAPVAAPVEAVEMLAAEEPSAPVAAVDDKVGPYDKTFERPAATREPAAAANPAPKKDADSEVSGDWHVARLDTAGFRTAPDSPKTELPPFATDVSAPASTTLRSSPITTASSAPFDPDDLIGSPAPATTISPRPTFEPFHDEAPEAAPAETSPSFPEETSEREAAHSQVRTIESPMRPIDAEAKTEERPAARAMVPLSGALDDDNSFFRRDDSGVMKEPSGLYRREDSALFEKELSGGLRGKAPKWIAVSLGAAALVAGGLFLVFKGDGDKKPDRPALARGDVVARAEERRGEDLESGSARRAREEEARETEAREGDAREAVARRDDVAEARREEGERAADAREERAREADVRREAERARDDSEVEAPARRRDERAVEARTAEARREEPRREVARREEEARPEETTARRVEVRARATEPEPRRARRGTRAAARAAARVERREETRREAREESDVDRMFKEGRKLVARRRYKKAINPLEKVVAARPTAEAHYLLGEAYFELSKEGRALEQLEKATAMGSRRGKAFMMLGSLYSSAGKKAKARGAFEQYLRVDPRGKFAADAKAMLGQN